MTICGAVLFMAVAATPAAATTNAFSFVDRSAIGAQTRVIDVRAQEACGKASLPGARCLPASELFHKDGPPVDFHTLRWLLGTIGLSGRESVLVVGADGRDATAVGALLYLAGQRAVAVLDKPLVVPAKAEAGSGRSITREVVFTAPMRDRLLVAPPDEARGAIASGPLRQRLDRFAHTTAAGAPTRLSLAP